MKKSFCLFAALVLVFLALPAGIVFADETIEIEDWHDLNNIRNNLDAVYALANDLDENTPGYDEHVEGGSWEPIKDFKGNFYGGGYEIKNLQMDTGDDKTGLFGSIDGAVIKNLGIVDSWIRGDDKTGSLVGYAENSRIEGCYVLNSFIDGSELTGGLVGKNY